MLQQVGVLIVSFLITNWIYSEVLLFVPSIEPFAQKVVKTARIPTHDEWSAIASSREAVKLSSQVQGFLGVDRSRGGKKWVFPFKQQRTARKSLAKIKVPSLPYVNLFEPLPGEPMFLAGRAIFGPSGDLYWFLADYIPLI